MMDRANEFEEIHSSLISLNSDGWTGRAADHFREKFKIQIQGWADAQEAFSSASQAYSSYASTLQSAQSQCDEIRSRWQQGQQAVEQAQNNKADARSRAQAEGGIPMFDASCDEGPGRATMQGAEDDFQALVDGVNASGTALIAALDAGIAKLPERTWGDAAWRTAGSILLGLYEGVEALGKLMMLGLPDLSADLGRLWRGEITPAEFQAKYVDIPLNTISTIASGIANDPGKFFTELGKSLVDWDTWADDPGRAFGRLIPDIAITIATAGAAAGAKGLTGSARLAYVGREVFLQATHISDVQDIAHLSRALVNKIGKAGSHIASSVADAMSHLSHATHTPHTHVAGGVSHPTCTSDAPSMPNAGTPTHPSHGVAGPANSSTPNIAPGHQPNGVSSTAQPGIGPHTSGATNANVSTHTAAGNPTASTHTPVGAPANPYAHTNEAPMPDSGIRKNSDSANFSSSNSNQVNNGDFNRSANSNWQHSNGISEGHTGGIGKNNSFAGPAGSQTPFNTTPHTEGATAYSKPNHADAYAPHDQLNTSAGPNEMKLSDQRSNDLVGSFAGSSNAHHPGSTANNIGGGVSATPHASHSNGMPAGQQGGGFSSSTPGTHGNSSIPSQGTPSSPGSSTHTSSGTTPYSGYGNPHQGTYGPGNHQGAPSSAQPASGAAPAHNTDGSSPVHPKNDTPIPAPPKSDTPIPAPPKSDTPTPAPPKSDTPIPAPPKSDTPIPAPPKVDASNAHSPGQTHHAGHTTPETTHGADTHTQKADGTTGTPTESKPKDGTTKPDGTTHTADPTSNTHETGASADASTGNKYKDNDGSAESDGAAHPTTSEDDLKNKSLYDILSDMESSHAHHSTPDAPHATHVGADGATNTSHAGHGDTANHTADGKPPAADPSTPAHEADGATDAPATKNKFDELLGNPNTHGTTHAPNGTPHAADPTTPAHTADGSADVSTGNKYKDNYGSAEPDGSGHTTNPEGDLKKNPHHDTLNSNESPHSHHSADGDPKDTEIPTGDHSSNDKADNANSEHHANTTETEKPTSDSSHKDDNSTHNDGEEHSKDTQDKHSNKDDTETFEPDKNSADGAHDLTWDDIGGEHTDTDTLYERLYKEYGHKYSDEHARLSTEDWHNIEQAPPVYEVEERLAWATDLHKKHNLDIDGILLTNDYTAPKYEQINGALRDPDAVLSPEELVEISKRDDFLTTVPQFEGTVFRGFKMDEGKLVEILESGTFSDPAYLSTSRWDHVAESFMWKNALGKGEVRAMYEIRGASGADIGPVSFARHEGEVLMGRNSDYKIVSYEKYTDPIKNEPVYHVILEPKE